MEWWFGHLSSALASQIDVVKCPMVRFNQPGHRVDADVVELVGAANDRDAFYLGSPDQLFDAIPNLEMRTAIWADAPPSAVPKLVPAASLFDVVFSAQRDAVAPLQGAGLRQVEWLPFAVDTTLRNDPDAEKIHEVAFVGSLEFPATRAERLEVLGQLERKYRMNDYRRPVFGDEMMRTYNQSRIVVNIPWGGLNMRTFEALASGALLLTKDVGSGQDELFKNGIHLVTYRDRRDLIDKIDYFLSHDDERRAIAAAGMREVLARHTYHHRAARLLEVMASAAPARTSDRTTQIEAHAAFYDYLDRADLLARSAFVSRIPTSVRLRFLTRAALKFGRSAWRIHKRADVWV